MTLIELLVVASILVVLMGVALPLMRPALEESKLREASRQVNAFVQMAKMRAAENGRDFGLWIERSTLESNAAFEIYLAERPRPYAGDFMNAKALLYDTLLANGTAGQDGFADRAEFDLGETASMLQLVQVGDLIRFGYKGPQYRIDTNPTPIPMTSRIYVNFSRTELNDPSPQPVGGAVAVPFQISRSPVKVATRPLQLTGGVVLDLQHSGMGYSLTDQFNAVPGNTSPVVIMFRPSGAISQLIYFSASHAPNATVHLLIGKFDGRAPLESTPETPNPIDWSSSDNTQINYSKNVADPNSIWVAVGNRNGTVTTSPNGWFLTPGNAPWPANTAGGIEPPFMEESLARAREFAQTGQTDGGG